MSIVWEPRLGEDAERLRAITRELTERYFEPLAEELDRDQRYPEEHIPHLVESGLAGIFVPERYGGQGAGVVATCVVMEEIARGCPSTSGILGAYVLGAFPLLLAGTEEQRDRYLSGLAREGEAISFALTEYQAGSDAAGVLTTATPEDGRIRLQGEKWFIGNGGASRHYVVFAKADPGSHRLTAYMVDREADGVTIDHFEDKMGIRGTLTSNLKLDTLVSEDDIVGEPGRGLRIALQSLTVGRIAVAAQSLGIGIAAFEEAARRAVDRHAFGGPIIDNQGISFRLADVATELSSARMLTYTAAEDYDHGRDVSALGPMAKLTATEASHRAVDAAVQVFGGFGYCKPYKVERLYRDQRIVEIYEGTSEIQRLVLGRAIKDACGTARPEMHASAAD